MCRVVLKLALTGDLGGFTGKVESLWLRALFGVRAVLSSCAWRYDVRRGVMIRA